MIRENANQEVLVNSLCQKYLLIMLETKGNEMGQEAL